MLGLMFLMILMVIPIAGVMSAIKTTQNKKKKAERLAELCEIYGTSEAKMEAEIDTIVSSRPSLNLWFLDDKKTSAVKEFLDEARKGQ